MQRILNLRQSTQKLFAIGLMLIAVSCLMILGTAPSYAGTYAEQKLVPPAERTLTPEEKIERASDLGQGAGMLEEAKQRSQNANTLTKPNEKMNVKTVTTSKSEQGLVEKAKELVEKVKGNE
ncbi:hypothetical protein [Gloeocapsopsis dulcis]|uniref:Uncharacterized protein n=1 Tax=Gloeocapsopsis dulcis AAB1 = 1H9 TaxID=1433147 RepID=A0A6N8FQ69_9CHRO|nr:hypothetical protein [Gloeocapsopsis dulcis]MUL35398.1 hypothetical protein [Gloeocapsopsis dulcis AAB1 = 1H9]WNN90404.1 hypothetical protein P0S91_04740 [Gloeocapsopsis dulcis]